MPFAGLAEFGVNSDMYNKSFGIACEDIVFKFENDFKSNMKIILPREDVVFKLLVPQVTRSSRRPFLRFLTGILNNKTFDFTKLLRSCIVSFFHSVNFN